MAQDPVGVAPIIATKSKSTAKAAPSSRASKGCRRFEQS
jgi:hypothetical protein